MVLNGLSINTKSVITLRETAKTVPIVSENIVQDTETLINVYNSVVDMVGPHSDDFYEIIKFVKIAQENASGAILEITKGLNELSDYIEKMCPQFE